MMGRVSDGPTSHAVLEEVPGGDLEHILTDFIKECRRRTLLGGTGGQLHREAFWIFYSLKSPHSWDSESFRQDIEKCSTWNFFPYKMYLFITDCRKKLQTIVDLRMSSIVVTCDLEVIT